MASQIEKIEAVARLISPEFWDDRPLGGGKFHVPVGLGLIEIDGGALIQGRIGAVEKAKAIIATLEKLEARKAKAG